jgi:hypothetical protein
MKFLVIAMSLGVVLTAFTVPAAFAEEKNEMKKEWMGKENEGMCRCPMCQMAEASREEGEAKPEKARDEGQQGKMMQQMGMSKGMMDRCRMMMRAQLDPADPAAILAMKDELGLSEEQIRKLQQMAEATRSQAKGVLTEEQKKKLQQMPKEPRCPMDMHEMMMKRMADKMGKKAGKDGGQPPEAKSKPGSGAGNE